MKLFIVFFNRNGNRKMAIELDKNTPIAQLDNSITRLITGICNRNEYTFSYYSINDNDLMLKNIPILSVDMLK